VEPLGQLMPRLVAAGVRAVSPNGILGDPAGASAREGRALLAAAIADLKAFVANLPARRFSRPPAAEPAVTPQ
jgi:creatinine amidohydrolase/Fe(II)-dependent formamide hydrolase-like protein